ncbi:hypothetical protein VM1G_03035 [Cytospora mali]|uniref:DUF7025 domain-containing protein n=1 Tax=Cytospora mali TaxID=578113 RepID=A0A194VTY1_CYTMA|nr:hypothetical protein VM1G_03035 [Valsa mali]
MAKEDDAGSPPPEIPSDDVKSHRIWIRYRTELCHRFTGEVLRHVDSEEPGPVDIQRTDNEPIFELVTRYIARDPNADLGRSKEQTRVPTQAVGSTPSCFLRIYSPAIINALQSVVEYYPGQDLSGTTIVIRWPYPILVHHYEKLCDFKTKCKTTDLNELCVRERDAAAHIDLLLHFLDDNIMEQARAEEERIKRGYYTFENFWVSHKPGRTIVFQDDSRKKEWVPLVISSIGGGIFENPPMPWTVFGWSLTFDGESLGRISKTMLQERFDGERKWQENTIYLDGTDTINGNDALEKLILDGERYWSLVKKQCKYHNGKTVEFPYNEIDGLVMVDLENYYETYPDLRPLLVADVDCKRWSSDCTCSV